jgi:hypothetical protein
MAWYQKEQAINFYIGLGGTHIDSVIIAESYVNLMLYIYIYIYTFLLASGQNNSCGCNRFLGAIVTKVFPIFQ